MKKILTIGVLAAISLPFAARAQAPREIVITAENNFAAQVAQLGSKTAFLAATAPTAFTTEAGKLANAQEVWTARSVQPNSRLTWYPVLVDAAQSGDLGYTSGPWTVMQNNQPQAAGEYVTVWRKQLDGQWKIAVNMGIERIGTSPAKAATVPGPRLLAAAATPSVAPSNVLLDLDSKFAAAELLRPGETYQQYLSSEARLYRPGLSMMQGAAASANMKNMDSRYFFAVTTGYLAAAGDLGYVVGSLRRAADSKHPEENGTYLRIWRREAVAGWRIVAEVFNLAPTPLAALTPTSENGPTTGPVSAKRAQ